MLRKASIFITFCLLTQAFAQSVPETETPTVIPQNNNGKRAVLFSPPLGIGLKFPINSRFSITANLNGLIIGSDLQYAFSDKPNTTFGYFDFHFTPFTSAFYSSMGLGFHQELNNNSFGEISFGPMLFQTDQRSTILPWMKLRLGLYL